MAQNERALAALANELARVDEAERLRRIAAAEEAVPYWRDLAPIGPVPLEYTPTPGLGPAGPGGVGPRQMLDPRFGDYPAIGSLQGMMMRRPTGDPGRAESVRRGYSTPASERSYYPALEQARNRHRGARAAWQAQRGAEGGEAARAAERRLHDEYLGIRGQAWNYSDPSTAGSVEEDRLLEEVLTDEASRQQALQRQFGTTQERAEDILALEALRGGF